VRITLDELRHKQNPVIDLLEILSLEGQHYMARLSLDIEPLRIRVQRQKT
jgi:hypothetical protein